MKVLHVFNSHRHAINSHGRAGGSDNACAETIRLSRESGIEVELFARSSVDIAPGLRGRTMAALSGVYAPGAIRAVGEAVQRFRPDVVHTHELYPLISPWVLRLVAQLGVPIVHMCYDFRLSCPIATNFRDGIICHECSGGREYRAVLNNCRGNLAESIAYAARNAVARRFRLFADHVTEFLVPAEFSRDWLIREHGIDPGRITVNYCGIECPPTAADPGQGGYVAFAGRFVVEKGVELLVEAARRTGLPVRLAGDAMEHKAIRPGDPVTCVQTRTREELAQFYRGARMLVVPSIWHETFPLVAAEAMGHGIPVVAVRLGGLPNMVCDGVSGVLFEPHDVAGLAAQMTRLWNDPALCRALGAAGRERVRTEFSGAAHVRRLNAAYQRAIAGRVRA